MDTAESKRVVRSLVEALWAGRLSAADEHPGYWQTMHTFGAVRDAFPDLAATVQRQLVEGDVVVTQLLLAGTHRGAFLGAGPTGDRVEWSVVYVDTLRDGKVVEHASGDGWMDLLMAIGAIPPPG